ncbi:MAG: hypothetical protein MUE69_01550 [Myxococcota bacterium]|jgi:hypothetical protein|nr:hypothetical protein [Myxococcota bacterium]
MRAWQVAFVVTCSALVVAPAAAQRAEPRAEGRTARRAGTRDSLVPPPTSVEHELELHDVSFDAPPVVLRPSDELRPLAVAVQLQLRRQGHELVLGPPPPAIAEAVGRGEIALVSRDGHLWLGVGAHGGATHGASLALAPAPTSETIRALALAVESLLDQAESASWNPRPAASTPAPSNEVVYLHYDDTPPPREGAKPTVFLKVLMGWSPSRDRVLLGPGAGFGLCVGLHCVVLEAELPLLPDERPVAGGTLRYRALSASVRGQARVALPRALTVAIGLGLVSRIGTASLVGHDLRRTTSAFGARTSLELAWRVRGPFELVAEGGLDAMLSDQRGRYRLPTGQEEILEDRWTPWLMLSLRLRPAASGERT